MGAQLRVVKRRIRSVQSTKKITRAMELIAASRVVKAQNRMHAAKPYVISLTDALMSVQGDEGWTHPWLQERETVRSAAVIVVTSDRGLAGPYSSNVLRAAEELIADLKQRGVEPKLYVTGRKGASHYRYRDRSVVQSWVGFSDSPSYEDARAVADVAIAAYAAGEVDEIYGVFTHFISSFTQRTMSHRFLPLETASDFNAGSGTLTYEYDYSPEPEELLRRLLLRYVQVRIYSTFLEASASEHAARRRAMNTATDNANKLIDTLTRQYNQARQAEITQELMEVIGAGEAANAGS